MEHSGSITNAELIRRQLERILGSEVFASAKRSQAFLRYVVEQSILGFVPKEYEIAVEVLERSPDYDPTVDATVRVEASRLRNRLAEYYNTQGRRDPILIDVPKGAYAAVCTQLSGAPDVERKDSPAFPPETIERRPPAAGRNGLDTSQLNPRLHANTKQPDPIGEARTSSARRTWLWTSLLAALSIVLAFSVWSFFRWHQARNPIRALAVLPLQNLSGDPSQNYFAAGMTDELTTELARIPGLRVVSRTSAVVASRSQKSLPQIAAALKVDAVVEGSVLRSGNQIRITAQLIDAKTDKHLWAQSFEGPASDLLSLQDTVADEIASQAKVALLPPSHGSGSNRNIDPVAHDAYLRGLYFFHKQDFDHSTSSFQQAIAIDSSYASAYAGLATALDAKTTFQTARPDADMQQAIVAAERAIQLDPDNGEAYIALGSIQTIYSWNWSAAEQNLLRGIALSPSSSIGEMKYASYLDAVGRPNDAVNHMRRALDLDPMSFLMTRRLGATLYLARNYQQAIETLQQAAQMEPGQSLSFDNWMRSAYEMQGQQSQAVQSDLAALHRARPGVDAAALDEVYRRNGWQAYWRARINVERSYLGEQCAPYRMAISQVRVGDLTSAFSLFNHAVDQRCYSVIFLKTDPILDPIRSDPRYAALLQRVHLTR